MPIGFNPDDTVPIRLDCLDGTKPEVDRAVFKCRLLTSKQVARIDKLRDEAWDKEMTLMKTDATLDEALLIGIVGWNNVRDDKGAEVAFSPEALGEFTPRLKSKMVAEYPTRVFFAEGDLKNSTSPCKPDASAEAGAINAETAATAPASPNPST